MDENKISLIDYFGFKVDRRTFYAMKLLSQELLNNGITLQ